MTSVRRTLPAGLCLIFLALCGLIVFEITGDWSDQPSASAAQVAAPSRTALSSVAEPPDQHAAWFRDIVARPLFSPDRKPVGSTAHTVAGLPRLTGIMVAGSQRIAIFAAPSGSRPVVVEAGSNVGVYHVREIADNGVTVVGPEGITVIRPMFDAASTLVAKPSLARPELSRTGTK